MSEPARRPTLNLLVLRSEVPERSVLFYEGLGLEFTRHRHGNGPEHFAAEAAGFVLEIYPATGKFPPAAGLRLGFRVDSVDALIPGLSALNSEILTPPHDSEWGRRAIVKDLDGHTVELVAIAG